MAEDNLPCTKCLYPVTVGEIIRLHTNNIHETLCIKLDSYNILQVQSLLHPEVKNIYYCSDVNDDLFDRSKKDYEGFVTWFNKKNG